VTPQPQEKRRRTNHGDRKKEPTVLAVFIDRRIDQAAGHAE
jgi:hypothetical protein